MSRPSPIVILMAPHNLSMELLCSLRSMNLQRVLGVYRSRFVQQCRPPGRYIVDDFTSPQRLAEKLESWRRRHRTVFGAIVGTDDEERFELSAFIAERFGLDFYDERTRRAASNKYAMKRAFAAHGVPTAPFALISDGADPAVCTVGFPSVLKMISGSGSEFIQLNRCQADLEANLAYVQAAVAGDTDAWFGPVRCNGRQLDPRREFLLEGFLRGDEYSCDFMATGGEIRILRVVRKYAARDLGYFRGYYLMNRASIARSGIELPYLESVCKRIAAAFGISRGVCMVDLMLTADGLQVLESSIRPGLSTFVPLMQQVYGYTSLGLLVRLVQGENVAVTLPDDEGLVVHILARGCGRIVRFDMSRVETGPGVIDMHRYAEAGDVVEDSRLDHWDSLLGYVLVKNPPPGRIPEVLEEIDDAVDLSMAEAGLGCRAPAG